MEQINNRLTDKQKEFFNNLSIYIDKPIYFYGSIIRMDYIPGKSDIDIDIFTDNELSTINMLCNYLGLNKYDFKKSLYKINSKMVYGYKGKYEDKTKDINIEIAIYNTKYKDIILQDHSKHLSIPFFVSITLIILKFFYYNLGFISTDMFKTCKQNLLNPDGEVKFIIEYS